ncbi:MAG: TetR/AcrR family transcriptional regulator [Umezawaea sp.]
METTRKRTVNPRGQGAELRQEILDAAARLLTAAVPGGGVTLRAIAREAGIAAPSIYPHFADRDAILDAVVGRAFEQLGRAAEAAGAGAESGAAQVRAICHAYLDFARENPGQYRVLFERTPDNVSGRTYPDGIAAFDVLVRGIGRSVAEGSSTSDDPVRDGQALWAALHGLATLLSAAPAFPWRPTAELVDRYLTAITELRL